MNMQDLKLGDIVLLNSGSPNLTVTEIDREVNVALCEWSWQGEVRQATLPVVCIKKAPELGASAAEPSSMSK